MPHRIFKQSRQRRGLAMGREKEDREKDRVSDRQNRERTERKLPSLGREKERERRLPPAREACRPAHPPTRHKRSRVDHQTQRQQKKMPKKTGPKEGDNPILVHSKLPTPGHDEVYQARARQHRIKEVTAKVFRVGCLLPRLPLIMWYAPTELEHVPRNAATAMQDTARRTAAESRGHQLRQQHRQQ